MSLANVSFVKDGEESRSTFPITKVTASGLLVVDRYSHTRDLSQVYDSIQYHFKLGSYRWCFEFYPSGDSEKNSDCICFRIYLAGSNIDEPLKVHIECSFIDQVEEQKLMNECYDYDCHGGGCTFRVKREVVEESNDIFMNDRFTVRCDMSIFTAPYVLVPLPDILQHLRNLLLSGEGTDVTFQVGGKTFTAHRCVLAAQSAVFKAELFGPMKEGTTNTVIRIDDMEAKVFKLLLGFMYSDSVPEIEEEDDVMWKHLLVAADRYDFMRLRLICEQKLCTYIGLSTVATILSLAEQHHCRGLKNACLDFLSNPANLQQVVSDDGFDHLTSSCPSVLKEIIARLASLMLDK